MLEGALKARTIDSLVALKQAIHANDKPRIKALLKLNGERYLTDATRRDEFLRLKREHDPDRRRKERLAKLGQQEREFRLSSSLKRLARR